MMALRDGGAAGRRIVPGVSDVIQNGWLGFSAGGLVKRGGKISYLVLMSADSDTNIAIHEELGPNGEFHWNAVCHLRLDDYEVDA